MGLTEEVFWELDPRRLDLVVQQKKQEEKIEWNRSLLSAGIVASMIYNVNRGKGKPAMKPEKFLIKEESKDIEKVKPQNLDDPKELHKALASRVRIKVRENDT